MFARHRDFLYKRSHNAHGLVARASPLTPLAQDTPKVAQTPDVTSDAVNPLTSVAPATKTIETPTQSASPNTPLLPTIQTSVAASPPSQPSSSSSSSRSSSTPAPSSAATPTASSALATPSIVAPSANSYVTPGLTTKVITGAAFTPSPTLASSPTSSAGSGSSGTNTGAIVGGIAGALAGIAVLGFFLMWCMRRQRNRDIDDFDAQAFKRQSAILIDDPVEPSRSYNPRPPTMIERHNASPALAAQPGYGGQNFYGGYGGYGQQPPYGPPEPIQHPGSPPPQPYGAAPMALTGYNDPQQRIASPPHAAFAAQQQLARQPSNATYLTRQPTSTAGYAPPIASPGPVDLNAQYIDLSRSSVSPYQAAQYADISRHLGATDPNAQVTRQSLALPEDPLPSPFDDPVEATLATPQHPVHSTEVTSPAAPQTHTEHHQRPVTVYDEGDAYGGI